MLHSQQEGLDLSQQNTRLLEWPLDRRRANGNSCL